MKRQIQTTLAAEEAVRARAYQIWEEEGRPEGRHETHWQRATEWFVNQVPAPATPSAPRARAVKTKARTFSALRGDVD